MRAAAWTAGLVLAFAAACGPTVETGGTGSGGSGTTNGSTGSNGSSGTGAGGQCAAFADQKGAASVSVHFVNQTGQPIFLPTLCAGVDYTITPLGGPDGTSYVYDRSCLQTCQDLQTNPQFECGACQQTTIRIDPGGTREVPWDGTGLRSAMMPAACWDPAGNPGSQCGQKVAAAPGGYRIDATGFSGCAGDCTCDAQGVCTGAADGVQAFPDPVMFGFPDKLQVDVVFSSCAFGCP
jgi:hypothetical protein